MGASTERRLERRSLRPRFAAQIYRLVLARAFAMTRRLTSRRIQPLLYLDEPGLYGFTAKIPATSWRLQELKLMVQALRKEGVWVGLHCCSNTDWTRILGLGLRYPLHRYRTFAGSSAREQRGARNVSHERGPAFARRDPDGPVTSGLGKARCEGFFPRARRYFWKALEGQAGLGAKMPERSDLHAGMRARAAHHDRRRDRSCDPSRVSQVLRAISFLAM